MTVALRIVGGRPRTRGECSEVPRPCPYASCRHHLAIDVNPDVTPRRRYGPIQGGGVSGLKIHDEDPSEMAESCSLDVADRGALTLEEVGEILGCTRERVRQIVEVAIRKLHAPAVAEGMSAEGWTRADGVEWDAPLHFTEAESLRAQAYRHPLDRRRRFGFGDLVSEPESGTRLKKE